MTCTPTGIEPQGRHFAVPMNCALRRVICPRGMICPPDMICPAGHKGAIQIMERSEESAPLSPVPCCLLPRPCGEPVAHNVRRYGRCLISGAS